MEPIYYTEPITSTKRDKWIQAMKEEMASLHQNKTWRLVERPAGKGIVDCRWLFKQKGRL